MFNSPFIIPVVALLIPIVAIVMKHLTQMRAMRVGGLSEGAAAELSGRAARLEDRVLQLERILDAEAPGWRSRA
ncbi:envelope stress response membrane protein PspB [Niveispirillum sp.]|uniref:envelope stress response membrane protein PspB n=1 Tax=Niveispirillum sp. TaxID=1917217 RepID=UPI001B513184|nr:envelope stress response membrane protein PspB [Niveispirillum sp.]MBP7335533.1 envelope stress response membrane protein PspB [Niveispirillum sp.]